MSLTAFKRKSVINYGSKRSGSAPGGVWLPQGPYGHSTTGLQLAIHNPGNSGFSINGGRRSVGGIGRDMKMSKSGTPYRGTQPIGWGGTQGTYPSATLVGNSQLQTTGAVQNAHSKLAVVQPVLNSRIVETQGAEYQYIKPSVLSTYGMLDRKYRWARYGQYPNYWVQPNYTGNQSDSASQGLYLQNLSSKNTLNVKVNNVGTYEGYDVKQGPTLCRQGTSTAKFKFNDMARNAPYTKILYQPVSYAQYNSYIARGCNNPVGAQKPFPYAVQTGTGIKTGGTRVSNVGNACNTSNIYLTPPKWYIESGPQTDICLKQPPQTTPFPNQ